MRQMEAVSQLGQSEVIDELERRVSAVELEKLQIKGFDITMH